MGQLEKDASKWPNINSCAVDFGSEENLRCSVPESDNLVSEGLERQPKAPSQAEIGNLNYWLRRVNQQVAWLEISVHYSSLVAVQEALENLVHNVLDILQLHASAPLVHVLFHIHVKIFKHDVKLVLSMHNV